MVARRPSSCSPRPARAPSLLFVGLLAGCSPLAITAEAGYARLALSGGLSLASGGGSASSQDVDSAFGLGDARDCPWVGVAVDAGKAEFGLAGFWLRERGTGQLAGGFGGIPAGTAVATDLELGVAKATAAIGFELGPVHVAPGILFDAFAIDFRAESSPGNREEVDDVVGVPMPFVRASLPFAGWRAVAEVGYLDVPSFVGDDGRFVDAEASMRWTPSASLDLLFGYRLVGADAQGEASGDSIGIDLRIDGWFIGGALRF